MKTAQLERELLALPPAERAQLALAAWESLVADPAFAADRTLDPEGLKLAVARDKDIESGKVQAISHEEFLRRTAKK
jgi:hypothetical protein